MKYLSFIQIIYGYKNSPSSSSDVDSNDKHGGPRLQTVGFGILNNYNECKFGRMYRGKNRVVNGDSVDTEGLDGEMCRKMRVNGDSLERLELIARAVTDDELWNFTQCSRRYS